MLLNKLGQNILIDGHIYTVGMKVIANDKTEYEGLQGEVIEIHTGDDKDTDNLDEDIIVRFDIPDKGSRLEKELLERFQLDSIDSLALDIVIMAPDTID